MPKLDMPTAWGDRPAVLLSSMTKAQRKRVVKTYRAIARAEAKLAELRAQDDRDAVADEIKAALRDALQ